MQESKLFRGVDVLVTALVTILIFLVMITIHEFGHFVAAKATGVGVLEFAIGMGPAIFKKQGKKTLYSVRIFPIGGYCSLLGENGESEEEGAFWKQSWWKRFLVVSAGAIVNLILGFVLFAVFVGATGPFASNVIDKVDERSYLAEAGVISGDKIVAINGHKVNFYNDISLYSEEFSTGENFELTVKRDREKLTFDVKPSHEIRSVTYSETSAEVVDIINGVEERYSEEFDVSVPEEYAGKTVDSERYIMGFMPKTEEVTAINILPQAWHYTIYIAKSVYMALWDMITGSAGLENVSGPVGVAEVVGSAVNSGANSGINILLIVAMLTVNLGIFNLLPLPALDGGRLFFMLIELVRGKPVPPEKEGMVHGIGLVLLLVLAVVICFNDILKLIR